MGRNGLGFADRDVEMIALHMLSGELRGGSITPSSNPVYPINMKDQKYSDYNVLD